MATYRRENQVTRSLEDQEVISLLETKMTRVEVNGIPFHAQHRYKVIYNGINLYHGRNFELS